MRQPPGHRCLLILSACLLVAGLELASAGSGPASALPAPVATPSQATPPVAVEHAAGAAVYKSRCARCHSLEAVRRPMREAAPGADVRADYLAFLARHRKSRADEHAAITDYLLALPE